jgi:partitioning defective protein 6
MRRNYLEVKSKLDAEFRRFPVDPVSVTTFDQFYNLLAEFHLLKDIAFLIFYEDPSHGDLLPINNDENFAKAVSTVKASGRLLRIILQRKGKSCCFRNTSFNNLERHDPHVNETS